ncbi:hypothetical protein R3P38DRAFT_2936793 [Favolaschia claudopus]|uniref:Uncharacterized protein n=1 Tax=Favolaschia claudopus TaxID=2862362 RepID=A0AAW0BQK3_9AGAR
MYSLTIVSAAILASSYFSSVVGLVPPSAGVPAGSAGSIIEPPAQLPVTSGDVIPFTYVNSNWCNEGYTPITVYLSESEPAPGTLNGTGGFPEGTYTTFFGQFLIPNYGLKPLPGSVIVPETLTIPTIAHLDVGSKIFLSVVETALAGACPPGSGVPAEYRFTTTDLIVAA